MSIILDALRRGRRRQTPRRNPNAAQTDAVLQTLGYNRLGPATAFNRLKRWLIYLTAGVLLAIAVWGVVVWATQAFLARRSVEVYNAPSGAPDVVLPPPPDPPIVPDAPVGRATPAESAVAKPSPQLSFDAVKPVVNQPIVQSSPRLDLPPRAPTPPSGTPSRPSLSTSAGSSTATVTAGEDHFRRALMYQRMGDFANALVHYKQLLQRDDLNAEAHNNLGLLYRDKGLIDDAVKEFQRAIAIEPRYARARNNLGVAYLNQGKLDMAASEFHTALAIDSRNVESLVNLSTVHKEAGRREEARDALVGALGIDPRNAEAHYNFALLEDEAGNREGALVHYRAFLQYGAAGYPALVGEVRKRVSQMESKK